MDEYTMKEFKDKFRPEGYGFISIDGEQITQFEEVLCDVCNAEIVEAEDKDKKVVFVNGSYAYCKDCWDKYHKNDDIEVGSAGFKVRGGLK